MKKKIVIESCSTCPHKDHSGQFTPGGAYPLCRKAKLPEGEKYPDYKGTSRVLPYKVGERYNHIPCRQATYEIPDWCPLEDDMQQSCHK